MRYSSRIEITGQSTGYDLPPLEYVKDHRANPFDMNTNAHYFLVDSRLSAAETDRNVVLPKYGPLAGIVRSVMKRICMVEQGAVTGINHDAVSYGEYSWDDHDEFKIISNRLLYHTDMNGTAWGYSLTRPDAKSNVSWFSYIWNYFDECLAYAKRFSVETGNVLLIAKVEIREDIH